jgi:hypothetical protein
MVDRQFSGIGRIRRASGTSDRRVLAGINKMLDVLYEQGLHGQLEAIRDGSLKPIAAYAVFRTSRPDRVPDAPAMMPLEAAWTAWEEATPNTATRKMRRFAWAQLKTKLPPAANVSQLPTVLQHLRKELTAQAPTFNRVRACVLSFLKGTLGKGHGSYLAVRDIEGMTEHAKRRAAPTLAKAITVRRRLGGAAGEAWWSMVITGMGPKELDGSWSVGTDRIAIHGTKRGARDRIIPRFGTPVRRGMGWKQIREAIAALPDELKVQRYDGRRAFAHLIEEAGIPRTRRRMYLGHAVGDVTDRYETTDLAPYLAEDAEKVSALLVKAEAEAGKDANEVEIEKTRQD